MTRGEAELVTAAVTLNHTIPRDQILRRKGVTESQGLLVSCRLQARRSPQRISSVLTSPVGGAIGADTETPRWSWYVTPKLGGSHTLVLALRPIVVTANVSASGVESARRAESSDVQHYETRVNVKVPVSERSQGILSTVAKTLDLAKAVVTALTLFSPQFSLLEPRLDSGVAAARVSCRNSWRSHVQRQAPPSAPLNSGYSNNVISRDGKTMRVTPGAAACPERETHGRVLLRRRVPVAEAVGDLEEVADLLLGGRSARRGDLAEEARDPLRGDDQAHGRPSGAVAPRVPRVGGDVEDVARAERDPGEIVTGADEALHVAGDHDEGLRLRVAVQRHDPARRDRAAHGARRVVVARRGEDLDRGAEDVDRLHGDHQRALSTSVVRPSDRAAGSALR